VGFLAASVAWIGAAGVSSGVSWFYESLLGAAESCAVTSEKQAVESSDFRFAAIWCRTLRNTLPGF
jgi:hypothetical protein